MKKKLRNNTLYGFMASKVRQFQYKTQDFLNKNEQVLHVHYYKGEFNFGDILNKFLIEELSGKKVLSISTKYYFDEHILAIGSVLDQAIKNSVVWGSGYISENSHFIEPPKAIYAVRGKKTREKLLHQGIKCPEVYGDPALLLPLIFLPEVEKKYELGIIPHYVDKKNEWVKRQQNLPEIKIIDIQRRNPLDVVTDILACKKIASSSLHGIIVADAYNIPAGWIKLSDKLMGGKFKFLDYYSSIEKRGDQLNVDLNTSIDDVNNNIKAENINLSDIRDNLLDNCPFTLKGT